MLKQLLMLRLKKLNQGIKALMNLPIRLFRKFGKNMNAVKFLLMRLLILLTMSLRNFMVQQLVWMAKMRLNICKIWLEILKMQIALIQLFLNQMFILSEMPRLLLEWWIIPMNLTELSMTITNMSLTKTANLKTLSTKKLAKVLAKIRKLKLNLRLLQKFKLKLKLLQLRLKIILKLFPLQIFKLLMKLHLMLFLRLKLMKTLLKLLFLKSSKLPKLFLPLPLTMQIFKKSLMKMLCKFAAIILRKIFSAKIF